MNPHKLAIHQYNTVEEAPVYREGFLIAEITSINIVRKGTKTGKSTVDIIFADPEGQHYVTMITGELFKKLTEVAGIIGSEGPDNLEYRLG